MMTTKTIGELYFFHPKSKIKAGDGLNKGEFPFYTSSSVLKKRIDNSEFNTKALIFGTGGSASVHFIDGHFSVSTECLVASSNDEEVNIKYTFYYLHSHMHILERGFKGAGLKHISKTYINNISITYPDIKIQNKIVTVLDKARNLIEKREKTIVLFDEMLNAIFLDMFGDPVLNPKSWLTYDLNKLAKLERGKFSPRPRNDPSYFDGKHPFIQTGDIAKSNYRLKRYSQTLNDKGILVSKQFNIGTVVIAIVGATIGATSILEIPVFATDSVIGITPKIKKLNNIFLEMLLRFQKKVLADSAPQAARANINLSILGKVKTICPPIELQKKYAAISNSIYLNKEKSFRSKRELEDLINSLYQLIFKGELTFNNVVDLEVLMKNDYKFFKKNSNADSIKLLLERLDKHELNENKFYEQQIYDKAKRFVFELLKEGKIKQVFDDKTNSVKLKV